MAKKVTIEHLAQMVARGFEQTATKADLGLIKEDLKQFATKKDLERFATKLDLDEVERSLEGKVESGFSDIADKLVPKLAFEDLESRVKYVETKLSIVSGK